MIKQFRTQRSTGKYALSIEAPFPGTLESQNWFFLMDKSKWEIYISQFLGNKKAHADRGNAVLSGQQKQQNVPAERVIKVVAAVMDYALWLFSNGVNKSHFLLDNVYNDCYIYFFIKIRFFALDFHLR